MEVIQGNSIEELKLNPDEQIFFDLQSEYTRKHIINFLVYRSIIDNEDCRIVLTRKQFLIAKFFLINLKNITKLSELRDKIKKDYKDYSKKVYEYYNKDVTKILQSSDKIILRKINIFKSICF